MSNPVIRCQSSAGHRSRKPMLDIPNRPAKARFLGPFFIPILKATYYQISDFLTTSPNWISFGKNRAKLVIFGVQIGVSSRPGKWAFNQRPSASVCCQRLTKNLTRRRTTTQCIRRQCHSDICGHLASAHLVRKSVDWFLIQFFNGSQWWQHLIPSTLKIG